MTPKLTQLLAAVVTAEAAGPRTPSGFRTDEQFDALMGAYRAVEAEVKAMAAREEYVAAFWIVDRVIYTGTYHFPITVEGRNLMDGGRAFSWRVPEARDARHDFTFRPAVIDPRAEPFCRPQDPPFAQG